MFHKRIDYRFNGYHSPFVPRAARSARRRGLVRKKVEGNESQLCAFDLLATVAGKILLEGESSHLTAHGTDISVMHEDVINEDNKGITAASPPLTLELGIRGLDQDFSVKENPGLTPDAHLAPTSLPPSSNCLEKNNLVEKINFNDDFGCHYGEIQGLSLGHTEPCVPSVAKMAQNCVREAERLFSIEPDSHRVEDPEILDGNSPTLVSSDDSVKLTLGNERYYPCSSQSPCRGNNVNVVSRDDDENSSECIQPSKFKTARSPLSIGDRRIRKLLESKYWRTASKTRDGDVTDSEVRCLYRSRKTGYKSYRSQRIYPFKRRRFYHYNSLTSSHADVGFKGVNGLKGSSACGAGQSTTFSTRESHVKLKIKSFRVPELFIEMPETASVGSLKRAVMEAVSALIGGGLRVGVLLQGKKIRDDSRTLMQSGICHDKKTQSLSFSLEPNPSPGSPPICPEENPPVLSPSVPQPLSRCPLTTSLKQGISHHLSANHLANNIGNIIESDHDSAPSPTDFLAQKCTIESRALVPNGTPQPLSVVHSHHKSNKQSDMSQRRIRRPFSVFEVEALVQAVEKLGTGRWRDVKLLAFDNVKHRTYVDLKDKWKTLVHTARIAPQQRRGEPVPQELLDRVLAAHAFWTHHQSKLELNKPTSGTHLLL